MKGLRQLFESIAYAGMKPGKSPQGQGKRLGWLGPLADPVIRFLEAGARPNDPFYLTNRTFGQKMRLAAVIAVPCLLVGGGIGLAALGYLDQSAPQVPPSPTLSPEQVAKKMLPNLDKDLKIDTNHDVEVSDVRVENGQPTKVVGTARNNTDHMVQNVEVVFDLTDSAGSRLGAVTARVPRIDANGSSAFNLAVVQHTAAFALVREIRQQ